MFATAYAKVKLTYKGKYVKIKKYIPKVVVATGIVVSLMLALSGSSAAAYSGAGGGSSGSPYLIYSCAQLEAINNNLTADYELVRDINCNGISIQSIGNAESYTDFSGVLNGDGHTVTDLTITDAGGLFYGLDDATVENLNLTDGSVSGTGIVGTLAGEIDGNTTISNVHSSWSLSSSASYNGGLIGLDNSLVSITGSSYTGEITATSNSYNGGLVGIMYGANSILKDDFVASSELDFSSDSYSGGLVGALSANNISLSYDYVASTINFISGTYDGGLVGGTFSSNDAINYSFGASYISSGSGSHIGGIYGEGSPVISNDYYDSTLSGALGCSGVGSVSSCTAEDVSNGSPDYFESNSSIPLFGNWDFNSTWQVINDSYPTLQDISDFNVPTTPNNDNADGASVNDNYNPVLCRL